MDLDSSVVVKPWGHEYLYYQNDDVGMWLLRIEGGQSTSMHCHPKKNTGLILIGGSVEVSFLTGRQVLVAPQKLMIRRGLFHSTRAISDEGAILLEIESPKDKRDLVRLSDSYGRALQPYECEKHFRGLPTGTELLDEDLKHSFRIDGSNLDFRLIRPSTKNCLPLDDDSIFINLRGGFKAVTGDFVFQPGDVISTYTLRILSQEFKLDETSLFLRIK